MTRATLEFTRGTDRKQIWGRKDEEYVADFILVSRRNLTAEEYRIFNYHFLLGADWKLCCKKFEIDRATFFHAIYRIQRKLGRVFRELKPYGLFPLNEYFSTVITRAEPIPMPRRDASSYTPIHPPLRKAA